MKKKKKKEQYFSWKQGLTWKTMSMAWNHSVLPYCEVCYIETSFSIYINQVFRQRRHRYAAIRMIITLVFLRINKFYLRFYKILSKIRWFKLSNSKEIFNLASKWLTRKVGPNTQDPKVIRWDLRPQKCPPLAPPP